MQIGRRIYYSKDSGVVIWDKGEMEGEVQETSFDQDKQACPVLELVNTDQLGIVQYEYGYLHEQFAGCKGYIIDPDTKQPVFAE